MIGKGKLNELYRSFEAQAREARKAAAAAIDERSMARAALEEMVARMQMRRIEDLDFRLENREDIKRANARWKRHCANLETLVAVAAKPVCRCGYEQLPGLFLCWSCGNALQNDPVEQVR
jgi:hypothetical protein